MKLLKSLLLLIGLGMMAGLVACGGGSNNNNNNNTQPISVSLSSVSSTLYAGSTTQITATVTNDSSNAGVTWSCTPANTCGTFSSNSKTASGTPVTYTAPSAAGSVTITATSVTDSTKSASTSAITISTSTITVSLSTTPATLPTGGMAAITATVTNDSSSSPSVNWSCSPANSCGSFSPANPVPSGTSVTYTAPSTAGAVTVTATSATDNAISASAQITVTAGVATTLPDGNYVFSVSGTDVSAIDSNASNYFYVGTFTVVSGAITTGEQDFSDVNGFIHTEAITSGTIIDTGDGNLAITLSFTDPYINNGAGQVMLDATLVSSSKALLIENDSWASGTGELDLQSTTLATPSGGYAFYENGSQGLTFSVGGVINVDGSGGSGTISGTGSVFDVNNGGTTFPSQTLTTSSVTAPDAFGNVSFTLNITGGGVIIVDGYMIDGNRMRIVDNWVSDSIGAALGGMALTQTGTGSFSATSVAGSSYVFSTTGGDVDGYLDVAGVLTFNSDGSTLAGTLSYNDLTSMNAQGGEAITGNYSVDPTGRVTISASTASAGPFTFEFYLNGGTPGAAVGVTLDGEDSIAGFGWQQTTSTLNAGSLTGSYALAIAQPIFVLPLEEQDGVGAFNSDGVQNLTGFFDFNGSLTSGTTGADLPWSGTYATTSANGVLNTNITVQGGTTNAFTTYLIDGTQGVTIENDTNSLTLGYFAQQ